jgi:hypothetical protein
MRNLQAPSAAGIFIEVSPGELLDRITILEIKAERIGNPIKVQNVRRELQRLMAARDRDIPRWRDVEAVVAELRTVNDRLWDCEDHIRACELEDQFGPRFVEIARTIYRSNDERAALKGRINELLGSTLVEEKSYATHRIAPQTDPSRAP